MTWFALLFSTLTIALIAALLYAMPAITPPTLPLGVSVPRSRVGEPAIALAVRRFRLAIVGAFLVSVAVTAVLSMLSPTAGVMAPVLIFVTLGTGSYVTARSGIARIKREEKWYEGVPVRLAAEVTAGARGITTPLGWYIAALILLAITASIGIAVYPGLPDPLPIHWGGDGIANGYADKSVWSVFGLVMTGLAIVVLLFAISFLTRVSPARRIASDSPEVAAHRTRVQQQLAGGLLGQLALILAFEMSVLAIVSWSFPSVSWLVIVNLIVLIALMAIAIGAYVLQYQRAMSVPVAALVPTANAGTGTGTGTGSSDPAANSGSAARLDAPDDDHFWKGGIFYVNRHDPAIMVPKRFGVGWTVNLGHPVGIAIGAVLLTVIVAGITLAIVSTDSRH